ncbi:MAG: hypothetical protein IT458_03955 [Planctomycetes bacterium]|nr:hypothetical protein [Planctomycetota bacterium]
MRGWRWLVVGCLLAACGAPSAPVPLPDRGPRGVGEVLHDAFGAATLAWPSDPAGARALFAAHDVVVVVAQGRARPQPVADAELRRAVVEGVRDGACLLVLGHAALLAHALGFEPVAPDRVDTYRWGLDQRSAVGRYLYGLRVPVPDDPLARSLLRELVLARDPGTVLLGGGEGVTVETCHWEAAAPQRGDVLGRMYRERDGEGLDLDAAVLVRWREGRGQVLAYGNLPEPWRGDAPVGANARRFLSNAVQALHPGRAPRVALCVLGAPPPPAPAPRALAPLAQRRHPGIPTLAAWGWQVPLNHQQGAREPLLPVQLTEGALVPAARSGAGLVVLRATDLALGYPLGWSQADPLRRPAAYLGHDAWPAYGVRGLREIAARAHGLGLRPFLDLEPPPAPRGHPDETLLAFRFLARELFDLRSSGTAAFAGIGVREWPDDPEGRTLAVLALHQPDGGAFAGGWRGLERQGFVPALVPELGRPGEIPAQGLSDRWRAAFLPEQWPAAALDARTWRPSSRLWGKAHALAGGSYGDWVLSQAADFVRARLDAAPVLWWEAHGGAITPPDTVRYVHGVSLDPLRAAVAARPWATGTGGWRDLQRRFAGTVQTGFGAEVDLPHDAAFLQNNHLRLCGSGGALLFDPGGLARFRDAQEGAVVAAPSFLTTRIGQFRPSPRSASETVRDFVGAVPRGAGGYGSLVELRGAEVGAGRFPARLAHDDLPSWPRGVLVGFRAEPGRHDLEVVLRGVEGRGVVEVRREEELIHLLPFASGAGATRHVVRCDMAEGGERRLSLAVVDGGTVAVEMCRLLRGPETEVAEESRIVHPAGHRAVLVEQSSSQAHAERRTLTTIADWPGFVLAIDYRHAAANVRVTRHFGLASYRRVARALQAGSDALRGPFVLSADDPALPALAVVPYRLPRYHNFVLDAVGGLQLVGYPRSNEEVRVGFVFLRAAGDEALAHLPALCAEVEAPREIPLDADGVADLAPLVPVAHARVVAIRHAEPGPFLVREQGGWTGRGAQGAGDGLAWLHVVHAAGDTVRIAAEPTWRGPRASPGWRQSLRIEELPAAAADQAEQVLRVSVLRVPALVGAPGVTFAAPFDVVELDGRPWAYFAERTVYLPREPGTWRLRVRATGRALPPHVAATGTVVRACRYDESSRTLELFTEGGAGTTSTAFLAGPEPAAIEGGVRVAEEELAWPSDRRRVDAVGRGVVVRFQPGLLRVRYP